MVVEPVLCWKQRLGGIQRGYCDGGHAGRGGFDHWNQFGGGGSDTDIARSFVGVPSDVWFDGPFQEPYLGRYASSWDWGHG